MPPLTPLRSLQSLIPRNAAPYICPSCSIRRICVPASRLKTPRPALRRASTLASATAVNAVPTVAPKLKELYNALNEVKSKAGGFVSLGRLQLAIRGLEGREATLRVAVLGLDRSATARKLVRLLLADPLGDVQPWEDQLEDATRDSGESLLIRYGESSNWSTQSGLPTLAIPSMILQRHNLEILVSSIATGVSQYGNNEGASEMFLAPSIGLPSNGRITLVQYPVHKSLVLGEGLDGMLAYARLRASLKSGEGHNHLTQGVFDVDSPASSSSKQNSPFINTSQAEKSLDVFRQSLKNSVEYEHGWTGSGLPAVSEWLEEASSVEDGSLNPAVRGLISSVLENASGNMIETEKNRLQELVSQAISAEVRQELNEAIAAWSERAHTELRDTLGAGFVSKRWRRLAWWKLLWRVDDVSMNTEEILAHKWLPQAEKGIVYLSGRVWQAGLVGEGGFSSIKPVEHTYAVIPLEANIREDTVVKEASKPPVPPPDASTLPVATTIPASKVPILPPWPNTISAKRSELILTTIPPLQALSQRLLLFSLTTTLLTSSLSVLSYIAYSSASMYEAGAIAALGFVYSLRRLQTKWEAAREFWKGEIREEGRLALKVTEELMQKVVNEGGKQSPDLVEIETRKSASDSIEKAVKALSELA